MKPFEHMELYLLRDQTLQAGLSAFSGERCLQLGNSSDRA